MSTRLSDGPSASTPCQTTMSRTGRFPGPRRTASQRRRGVVTLAQNRAVRRSRANSGGLLRRPHRREQPEVRPPAASINSAISVHRLRTGASRPGLGRCLATYRIAEAGVVERRPGVQAVPPHRRGVRGCGLAMAVTSTAAPDVPPPCAGRPQLTASASRFRRL